MKKRALAICLALSMMAAPMAIHAEADEIAKEGDDLAIIFDLLVIRPISYAVMAGGAILYVPAAIITAAGGNDLKPIKDTFLRAPYKFAIERPLGQLEDD
ncbi:hypothetical protein ACFLQ0_03350 [Nitrospinota bacterium]